MTGDILFLCHRMPFPPDRGDKIRAWQIVRALAKIAPVHVGCFADDARDMGFQGALDEVATSSRVVLRDMNRPVAAVRGLMKGQPLSVALFDHPALHAWVADKLASGRIGAVFVYSGQMAQYVPAMLPDGMRFVMDFVDVDSEKFAAYGRGGSGPMAWVNAREGKVLAAFERRIAQRADASLFVSEAEAALFRARAGLGPDRVMAIGNGVDTAYFDPDVDFTRLADMGPLIVFTGQMDYRPNIDAVTSFARDSLPAIRARFPDARFAIVGRGPTREVLALGETPGVIVTGAVDDVRGWLAAASVVVAPLRIARGIQNKVLEAMAMAKPVVASRDAAEGIDAHDGFDFLIAQDAAGEADKVSGLLFDRGWRDAIGNCARTRVLERYGWDAAMAGLRSLVTGDAPSSFLKEERPFDTLRANGERRW